jgi:hypothetical protein
MKNIFKCPVFMGSIAVISTLFVTNAYAIVTNIDCSSTMAKSTLFNNTTTYDPTRVPICKTFTDTLGIKWKVVNSIPKGTVTKTIIKGGSTISPMKCTYTIGTSSLQVESTNINVYSMLRCLDSVCYNVYYKFK